MKLTKKAYAKLNLSLDVSEKLENGYHSIESIFQSVSLFDEIMVEIIDKKIDIICEDESLLGESNICFLAAQLFFEKTNIQKGAKITINKGIPIAAGLGGGSADAAAVLLILNELFSFPLKTDELLALGLKLGADVPFCIIGGTMYVCGVGEILKSTMPLPQCDIIIIKNDQKPSTKELYARLDSKEIVPHPDINKMLIALENGDVKCLGKMVENSFSAVWGESISSVKNDLKNFGALGTELSGSGPSVFGIFNVGDGKKVYNELKNKYKEIHLCTPVLKGVE